MPVVTMIGGGQLARMTHQAAIALGQRLRVLAGGRDDPAAQVSPDVVLGSHTDLDALRAAASGAHALTFDHEHVPTEHLEILVAEGVNVAAAAARADLRAGQAGHAPQARANWAPRCPRSRRSPGPADVVRIRRPNTAGRS